MNPHATGFFDALMGRPYCIRAWEWGYDADTLYDAGYERGMQEVDAAPKRRPRRKRRPPASP